MYEVHFNDHDIKKIKRQEKEDNGSSHLVKLYSLPTQDLFLPVPVNGDRASPQGLGHFGVTLQTAELSFSSPFSHLLYT